MLVTFKTLAKRDRAEALVRFSFPYVPWQKIDSRTNCRKCACRKAFNAKVSAANPSALNIINRIHKLYSVKSSVSAFSQKINETRMRIGATVHMAQPTFFVPRLKHLLTTGEVVGCCRFGRLRTRLFTTLRLFQTSEDRQRTWEAYTNGCWTLSGNKSAFNRIKPVILSVVECSSGKLNLKHCRSDIDWQDAIRRYDSKQSVHQDVKEFFSSPSSNSL